jgi:hypothetical protein
MLCPRCSHEQPAGLAECGACGIVFARFEAVQARAWKDPSPQILPPAAPPVRPFPVIPVAVLAVVIVIGAGWTAARRASRPAREKRAVTEMKEEMDRINGEMSARERKQADALRAGQRKDMQENEARRKGLVARMPNPVSWPAGMTEGQARSMIERCEAFTTRAVFDFPKTVGAYELASLRESNAPLGRTFNAGHLTYDRVLGVVGVAPAAWSRLPIRDAGNRFEVNFGRPRLEQFSSVGQSAVSAPGRDGEAIHVTYTWKFEGGEPGSILTLHDGLKGSARFVKKNGAWTVVSARARHGEETKDRCP